MRLIRSTSGMQRQALLWRRHGARVAFVPTMGCLHEGHLSLMRRARREAGPDGFVVASIFVNPSQFGPGEDFERYPRALARDRRLCRDLCDVLFVPEADEIYASSDGAPFSVYVVEEDVARRMEGERRPTHFRGVATIVAKLFNLVCPSVAVFGAKDFQQAAVIRRMTRDLNFPVRIVTAPTARESDGLALSSRNAYLNPSERAQANVLWRALREAQRRVRERTEGVKATELRRSLTRIIEGEPDAKVDYIEFFDPKTLAPRTVVRRGTRAALAVWIGNTRLIDNAGL